MFSVWLEVDWMPLWLTLKVAGIATVVALLFGTALGYFLARKQFWGKESLDALLTLPMVLPPTVLGYYILSLFGKKGIVGHWLLEQFSYTLIFNWHGAVLASAIVSYPLVFKSARAAFENVDQEFERVSYTLGQGHFATFIRVTLPLAWRGILAGTMLAFARAMGEFGATLMVAGNIPGRTQTLSLAVYDTVQAGNDPLADVLVLLTSLVCIAVLVIASRLLKSQHW